MSNDGSHPWPQEDISMDLTVTFPRQPTDHQFGFSTMSFPQGEQALLAASVRLRLHALPMACRTDLSLIQFDLFHLNYLAEIDSLNSADADLTLVRAHSGSST
jgi:hypothetical protein